MLHLRRTTAAATATVIALTGCAGPVPGANPAQSAARTASAPGSTPTPSLIDQGPNYVPIRSDNSKPFGAYYWNSISKDQVGYSRSIVIEVDRAGAYKLSASGSVDGTKAKRYARFKIVVTNYTKLTLDPTTFEVTAQDGDAESGHVYDQGMGNNPRSPIRPGRRLVWYAVFGNDADSPAVTVKPAIPDKSGQFDAIALGTDTWAD